MNFVLFFDSIIIPITDEQPKKNKIIMESFNKIHDCCGSDISNGVFGRIVRKCIQEITSIENHLSFGLAIAVALCIFIFLKWLQRRWFLVIYSIRPYKYSPCVYIFVFVFVLVVSMQFIQSLLMFIKKFIEMFFCCWNLDKIN